MKTENYLEFFKGKSGLFEKIALICNSFLCVLFLYDTIFSEIRLLFVLIPIIIIEAYIIIFCILPDKYCFTNDHIEILHFLKKTIKIDYVDVFNMDAEIKDNFINITKNNEIRIYYTNKSKKRSIVFKTKESIKFVDAIKKYCPVFKETVESNTNLNKIL